MRRALDVFLAVNCPLENEVVDVECCKYDCEFFQGIEDGVLTCTCEVISDDEEADAK